MKKNLSVIVPVFNEEGAIEQTINKLKEELTKIHDLEYEIVTINDASTDRSKEILERMNNIRLISHPLNKGYGASLKTGIREAKFNNLLFFDADGQHPAEKIKELLEFSEDFDLISGARIRGHKGPIIRQPGKKILNWIANYLTGVKIPDINCGFRVIKKNEILKFMHILPNGFSLSTTTTLAFLKEGLNVKFVPIETKKRIGKSTVRPKDAFTTLMLIIRIIFLFSPLKIFFPISIALFLSALASIIHDIIRHNVADTSILLFVSFILIFFFSLLADQLATIRRQLK